MNPGTSEMHFVAALDDVPDMHGVLALFEGVATGAADGYARIPGGPAATLLHLGPGLGNGLANLHNARRAHSPVVNIVGDHAICHRRYDAQLQSDIATVARNVSPFVRTTENTAASAVDVRGRPGRRARAAGVGGHTDSSGRRVMVRGRRGRPAVEGRRPAPAGASPDPVVMEAAAAALRSGERCALFIGGRACSGPVLDAVAALAAPQEPSCCARPSRPGSPVAPDGRPSSASGTWPSSP